MGVTLVQLRNYLDKFGVELDELIRTTPDQMELTYGAHYYDKWVSGTATLPASKPIDMPFAPPMPLFYPIMPMVPQIDPWMAWFPQPVPVTPLPPLFFNHPQPTRTETKTEEVTSTAPDNELRFFGPGKRRKESENADFLLGQAQIDFTR